MRGLREHGLLQSGNSRGQKEMCQRAWTWRKACAVSFEKYPQLPVLSNYVIIIYFSLGSNDKSHLF